MAESDLYEPIKEALKVAFPKLYLEVTATKIDDYMKEALDDQALAILLKERKRPDLMGFTGQIENRKIAVVEVKDDKLGLDSIYQIKKYAEILGAQYAFLIYTEKLPEELRRFLERKLEVLAYSAGARIILIRYLKNIDQLEVVENSPSHYWYNQVKKELTDG